MACSEYNRGMEALTEISNSIAFEIAAIENRQRKRTAEAQHHFEYAIEAILKDVRLTI